MFFFFFYLGSLCQDSKKKNRDSWFFKLYKYTQFIYELEVMQAVKISVYFKIHSATSAKISKEKKNKKQRHAYTIFISAISERLREFAFAKYLE